MDDGSLQKCPAWSSPRHELAPPVWVHSSWRVSSTWLWGLFRRDYGTLAYQEVFHENLSALAPELLADLHPRAWNSRHPSSAPYFLEYAPLLAQGRLTCDEDMAYGAFLPRSADRSITDAEAHHIGRLIDMAGTIRKTPVLTAVRSLGRVHGLRARFGGVHILLHRNLFRQWCSVASQELEGNPYFIDRTDIVIDRNQHDPFVAMIARLFPQDRHGIKCSKQQNLVRFVLLHLYLLVLALPDCDLEISVDRLSSDIDYQHRISKAIGELTGVTLDLSSCRESIEFSGLTGAERIEDTIETIRVMAAEIPAFLPCWTDAQQSFLRSQLQAFESEMERSLFYTRALTRFSGAGFPDLAQARVAATGYAAVASARDALQSRVHELEVQAGDAAEYRERLMAAEARNAADASGLAETLARASALEAQLETARVELSRIQAERCHLVAENCRVEDEIGRIAAEHRRTEEVGRALRAELDQLRHSTSWRITRPVRALKRALLAGRAVWAGGLRRRHSTARRHHDTRVINGWRDDEATAP